MVLEPPNVNALKDVLTLPLIRTGYEFDDPSLPDEMVHALGDTPNLSLLNLRREVSGTVAIKWANPSAQRLSEHGWRGRRFGEAC